MSLDLAAAVRAALMDAQPISGELAQWNGEPAIFTRRPVPSDAPYPFILCPFPAAIGDEDGLTSDRPVVMRDICIYGQQPDQLRAVDALSILVRLLFHRKKWAINPEGYSVIDIVARGPFPGPTDDPKEVARIVGLTVRLRRTS